ncbi:MAG: HNH endonuclease [Deltaproteobacteria bacterium]|nr:HNH endonuclease [Deltaproteobacteria bacterium]
MKRLHELTVHDHHFEAEMIAHLGEVDGRRLYLGQACSSMFQYFVEVLHFAEGVAYKRIMAARAARKFPELLVALRNGEIHLTAASLIAPHLTSGHAAEWIATSRHATAREIKQRIVDQKPKPGFKTSVRRASSKRLAGKPDGAPTGERASSAANMRLTAIATANPPPRGSGLPAPLPSRQRNKAHSEPLGAERYCIRFVADHGVHEQLQELRSLLRHSIPDGDVAKILARAVGTLLEQVRKQRIGACPSPRSTKSKPSASRGESTAKKPSRHIPAAVRRAVWERDGGCCGYVSPGGQRCKSREYLEFHHQVPWARCTEHTVSNISLRCRSHNQYEAELVFGIDQMVRFRRRTLLGAAEEEVTPESQLDSNPALRS